MSWLSWNSNLKVRLIGETIFHIFYWMFFPFMALHFTESFGKEVAGLILTIPPLVGVFSSLIGGRMADRIGRRPTMLLGVAIEVAMFALFSASSSPWVEFIAFTGLSIGGSIYWPASSAMVADLTTEEDRREVFATFYTAMNVGVVVGPIIGSFFFENYRSQLMLICFLINAVFGIVLFFMLKESLPKSARVEKSSSSASSLMDQWRSYKAIFSDRIFAWYIIAGILISFTFMQMDLYMPVYIKEFVPTQSLFSWGDWSYSINSTQTFGWMVGINGLLVVLFTLMITRLFSHWSDRNSLILSSIITGIGMFAMAFTTNVWLLFGCMVVFTIGELVRTPVAQSFISKYAPEDKRGQYMGASTLQFSIGRFLAPFSIGVSQWLSPIGVFGMIMLCAFISALIYFRLFRVIDKQIAKPQSVKAGKGGEYAKVEIS
ncbi:MDR family MFS transporter [Brevibacillus ginsengisoli]|uniref:MDR family MFS transporter n=1 Tax=Brevibacillus ginsengisoli TaxID=363854 RepID=UPI003CEE716C